MRCRRHCANVGADIDRVGYNHKANYGIQYGTTVIFFYNSRDAFTGYQPDSRAGFLRREIAGLQRETRLNAQRLETGEWSWRYDVTSRRPDHPVNRAEMLGLWADVGKIRAPCTLAYAEYSRFVTKPNISAITVAATDTVNVLSRICGY